MRDAYLRPEMDFSWHVVRQLRNEIKGELEFQLGKVQEFVDTEVSKPHGKYDLQR